MRKCVGCNQPKEDAQWFHVGKAAAIGGRKMLCSECAERVSNEVRRE